MSLAGPLYLIMLGGMLILAGAGLAVRAVRPAPPRLSAVMARLERPTRPAAFRSIPRRPPGTGPGCPPPRWPSPSAM